MSREARKEFFVENLGHYRQTGVLGSGSFGIVIRAVDETAVPKHEVAIKMLPRGDKISRFRTYVLREIMHQGSLKHPFIVNLKEVFTTPEFICIVMEIARGGDLLRYTLKHYPVAAQEEQARWIFQQLIIGLDYCHRRGVANRDLKLENLLMDQDVNGKKPLLKICDFGYSKHEMNSSAKSGVGTPIFMAPEIVFSGKTYDAKRADLWSVGVILYAQIYGRYPFDVKDKQYAQKFQHAVYLLPPEIPASDACKDLLTRLLVADPDKRISLQGILGHPWFLETLPSGALNMNDHYLQKTPNLTTEIISRLESMVASAEQAGQPGTPIESVKF